jgi:transcription antitermination factor NusG
MSFPENLLDSELNGRAWWVARTKSRREKALANLLAREEIGYFLPLFRKRFRSCGRVRFSVVPMFPGYLFFIAARQERYQALRSGHIAQVIEVVDQEGLVRELRQIQDAICLDAPIEPFPFVRKGQRVRVVEGPFMGLEGIIQKRKKVDRLVISVDAIQQSAALAISADWVEPI